jgi:hypothetical protein
MAAGQWWSAKSGVPIARGSWGSHLGAPRRGGEAILGVREVGDSLVMALL